MHFPAVRMRAIRYQRPGFRAGVLLTSPLDPKKYPAEKIVQLYHERWEIELEHYEIKRHLLDKQEAIRSRTPQGVRQEVWGILLTYNLVRLEMERAADEAGVEPTRISFVNALALIRNAWLVGTDETRSLLHSRAHSPYQTVAIFPTKTTQPWLSTFS